jgi:hypothetical protein
LLGCLFLPLAVFGADLTGIWVGQMPLKNGDYQEVAFKFVQKGTTLEGKLYGDYQSRPISDGKIAGDLVTFVVNAQEQAGNQINESKLRFTGRINGTELELFREREASRNAGDGGAAQLKESPKQSCHLKRLP